MKKNVVVVTNLYPNKSEPNRGVFIRQLVEELGETFNIRVICPVPWRPNLSSILSFKKNAVKKDSINGIEVLYPKHIIIPKILRSTYGWFMARALLPVLKDLNKQSPIDLISAHWVYPDGYGSVSVAKKLKIPVVVHVLGCDVNEYTKYWIRKKLITKTLNECDQVIVKSQDLEYKVVDLGVDRNKVSTILNGVDGLKFSPISMTGARERLNLNVDDKYLLFIGNIQKEKGLEYLLKAISLLKNFTGKLLVVGSGPLEHKMKALTEFLKIENSVVFVGSVPHDQIPLYLNAANALCLPSLREGCPNIVLEALSCGTPVLASNVGAVPQIITNKNLGIIVTPCSVSEIASSIPEILESKAAVKNDFNWYSWQENSRLIGDVFDRAILDYQESRVLEVSPL